MLLLELLLGLIRFLLGAALFSFMNVVAWRLPRGMDPLKGRSVCPQCGHTLGAPDLVPVFSWLFLRGRCRHCGAHIPARYLLVELLGGVLALVLVLLLGTGLAVNPHLKESIFNRRYAISQLLYSSPQYDYAYRPGDYLGFALSGDHVLYARRSSRISAEGFPESGELREVTLPDWYLRSLFCDGWVDSALLKELSKAQTAWVTQRKGERNFSFYLVLQNGKTVYLALCHGLWDTNTAGIRWLFELTRDERTFVTEDLQNLLQETMGEFDEDAPPLISASYQSDTLPGVLVARFTGVRKGIDIAGTAIFLDEGSLFGPTLRQVTSDDGTHDFSSQTIWLRDVGKTFTVVTASPDRTDLYEVRASWDGTTQRKYVVYHQSILVVFEWDEKFSSHAYDATSPDIRFYNLDGEELSRE